MTKPPIAAAFVLAGVFLAACEKRGATADAAISWAQGPVPFMTAGPDAPLWVSLAFADWMVKLALALIALLPFRIIVGAMLPRTT